MNTDWINFLKSNNPAFLENDESTRQEATQNTMAALTHFAILKVTGTEASKFLQGQLSCNIDELSESKSFFTAFCNAKGRTISTLLIVKTDTSFLLILPTELVEKVSQKLKMYIMRSDVQLQNVSDDFCLLGVNTQTPSTLAELPNSDFSVIQQQQIFIKFPLLNHRYLVIASTTHAMSLWTNLTEKNFTPLHSNDWIEQDISAGIPWLTVTSSEEFIPQMLNVDKLGGISFNKGCYTGQEIIARTHYLGKAKRELLLAYCDKTAQVTPETKIITKNSEQTIGKVLSLISTEHTIKMLIVMQSNDTELANLILNNADQDKIDIKEFH